MAKTSMVMRDKKRAKLVKKYAAKREGPEVQVGCEPEALRTTSAWLPQTALQKLPRDSSPCRQRNRCALTGRSRGVYRKFGLGRNKLREATMRGDVPGLRKASW